MIESGSHTPGVSAEDFALPAHTALRYELPDPSLRGVIGHYQVFDSDEIMRDAREWILPGWPAIWITFVQRPLVVTIGGRTYDPVPVAALYGPTSRAHQVQTHGGVTVATTVSPAGWARLFDTPADAVRDRLVPLDEVMPADWVEDLVAALGASDRGADVKAILDDFFLRRLRAPNADAAAIKALMDLVVDADTIDLTTAAARIGLSISQMRRVATRYFGFPPKLLLMRTRFMRILLAMLADGGRPDYSMIGAVYHDASHFLRDSDRFLGMTPRRFLALRTPYLRAVMRARTVVLQAARANVRRP